MRSLLGVMCGLCCKLKLFMYATISKIALYELIPPTFFLKEKSGISESIDLKPIKIRGIYLPL